MDLAACEEVIDTPMGPGTSLDADRTNYGASTSGHVFVAPAGQCLLHNPIQDQKDEFVVYHKHFPGLKTPFQLPIECFPEFESMLDEDPDCVDTVNVMLKGAVAESTAGNYKTVVHRFHNYCMGHGHTFPKFNSAAVLRFVKDCHVEGVGLAFFQKLLPALTLLENVIGTSTTALSGVVHQSVSAIKRDLSKRRGIVRKATGFSYAVLQRLIELEIDPHIGELYKIDAAHFRSIFRGVIVYCTFCRFDEFSRLCDSHFSDKGSHIQVIFERRKNDQFGDNSRSVIPERPGQQGCPVSLIRTYFTRFGLKFDGTGRSVNFRLQKDGGRHVPLWKTSLSQSNATKLTRELLTKHGYEGSKFTEKSFKVQGVTELMNSGEPAENVMVFGGWKRTTTPLHYRHTSADFLLGVASRLPM